jgi:hypothetical protein
MTEVDIGEDADTWFKSNKSQLPASACLADVYHYIFQTGPGGNIDSAP